MPELPEVETTCNGIRSVLLQQRIKDIVVRQPKLRQPVTENIAENSRNKFITGVTRRAKYIIINLSAGNFIIHLGMSGHLRIIDQHIPPQKHDHIDLHLEHGKTLRYCDPRRFGLWVYSEENPMLHPLFKDLGPEPLLDEFNADYLAQKLHKRNQPIKSLIMDNHVVVGVGNIYATESLFLAGIHPLMPGKKLTSAQIIKLTAEIKNILDKSIKVGGTTLRDFYSVSGTPGYFVNQLFVYGQKNKPCPKCKDIIQSVFIGGRNTTFCGSCQEM